MRTEDVIEQGQGWTRRYQNKGENRIVFDDGTPELTISGELKHDASDGLHSAIEQHRLDAREQTTEEDRRTKLVGRLDELETAAASAASWGGLTAAQRTELTRQSVLAVVRLARLVLRRLAD